MSKLPSTKVPKLETDGEAHREAQLLYQLPRQDLSLRFCQHVSQRDHSSFQDFMCARNDIALDVGYAVVLPETAADFAKDSVNNNNNNNNNTNGKVTSKCKKCNGGLGVGDLAVVAPRFGLRTFWHPACFTCTTCDEILVDLTYCVHNDSLYCERHYAENLKPRCGACDELIFAGQYTKVNKKSSGNARQNMRASRPDGSRLLAQSVTRLAFMRWILAFSFRLWAKISMLSISFVFPATRA